MLDKIQARELKSICCVEPEGRRSNLTWVLARGFPSAKQMPKQDGPLAIVASGPSVRTYLKELKKWPGKIWAINGAYDYLLDNRIIPDGFFSIDPLPGLADYLRNAKHKTKFFIASTSDPSVFEALEGYDVEIFHPADEDMNYPTGWIIGGGTTALTRVPYLALLQGFRDITMYGCDSSFDGNEYCYKWGRYKTDIATKKMWIEVNGEGPFETELGLMKQVSQLGVLMKKFDGRMKIRCGGLMDAFLRAPTMDDSIIEMADADTN